MPYGSIACAIAATWLGIRLLKVQALMIRDLAASAGVESVRRAAAHFIWLFRPGTANQPLHGWDVPIFLITTIAVIVTPFWWLASRRPARGVAYRHRVTVQIVEALRRCAEAYSRAPGDRCVQLRDLDRSLQETEDAILRAHRYARTIPRRSPRRAAARSHAAKVAGALRAEGLRIDANPDEALPRLGAMLTLIGERCAEGRIGALLPEESLEEITPVSATRTAIRESAHVAVVILVAMAAAIAASALLPSLGVKDDLRPWLIVGCSVLAAIMVGGWHRVGRILDLLPGK
ncbi:hypothetical protein [Streptomyces sp. x-80]|uniref:hypothetical protein n=1 Tax=Streptomyces sp. x-80 TaxID=2789282 RepID=UPI00397F2B70